MKELTEAEVMAVSGAGIASDAGKIQVRVLAPSWMPAPVFSVSMRMRQTPAQNSVKALAPSSMPGLARSHSCLAANPLEPLM